MYPHHHNCLIFLKTIKICRNVVLNINCMVHSAVQDLFATVFRFYTYLASYIWDKHKKFVDLHVNFLYTSPSLLSKVNTCWHLYSSWYSERLSTGATTERVEFESYGGGRDFSSLHIVQTDTGTSPASCPMAEVHYPGISGLDVKLITHLQLVRK
jgi:hypothetical protein